MFLKHQGTKGRMSIGKRVALACALGLTGLGAAWAQSVVYKCPSGSTGGAPLYTDAITPREAKERGCKALEGAPITVVPARKPAPGSGSSSNSGAGGQNQASGVHKVDPAEQKARDSDRRYILENELRKEEAALDQMVKEYNQGEPERRADERNAAKYLERIETMKAAIARKEADIAALKREISRLR